MISIRVPIEDLDNTVVSPVLVSILNELKKVLFIENDTHLRIINKETEYINKNWKAGNLSSNEINGKKLEEIEVEYDVNYDDQHIITTTYRHNKTKPIIDDENTGLSVRPLYLESILNIRFKLKNKSKTDLTNSLNNLKLRYIGNRDAFYHKALYLYYMPELVSALINNLLFNKNYSLDAEETFDEYLSNIVDNDRFTLISNQAGALSSVNLAFKEMQNGIIGYFKSDILNPEKTYNKDTGFWETDLEYEIRFDQPMFYDIIYPTVAYQFQLDKPLIDLYKSTRDSDITGDMNLTDYYIDKFSISSLQAQVMSQIRYDYTYIRIPETDFHDDVQPRELYTRIFSVQVTINKTDKKSLFNLNDIGDLKIQDEILQTIQESEWKYITKTLKSFVNIEIYENGKRMPDDTIAVNDRLDVYAVNDLDLTKSYRVFFNVVEQLNALEQEDKRRVLAFKDVILRTNAIVDLKKSILNTNSNFIRNTDVEIKLMENKDLKIQYYSYIIANILDRKDTHDRLEITPGYTGF